MAGIPSIPPAANTPLSSVQGGHEGHGGASANADNGGFSQALNQAIAQKANNPEGSHGAHSGQVAGTATGASSAHPNHFSIGQGGHAGHDFQQCRLAGTIQTQHANLGTGKEAEGNVFENLTLRRHDLADAVHGKNVLSHLL